MTGNGIDMYDLILNIDENNDNLILTKDVFWVGVFEQMYPSPPVPRRRTRCFTSCPVYLYNDQYVFSMPNDQFKTTKDFYYIPDKELIFIQKK